MLLKTRFAFITLLLVMAMPMFCFAVELPSGAVKGLPSGLVVLDEDGNSPNSKGEYFVNVDNMLPDTEYTKQVAIMNLREDAQYHVYFSAEHYAKYGTIDLENEVECCIYLDDKQIYKGLVNGKGDSDISQTALDLGNYKPNESAKLKATFVWTPSADSEAQMQLYDTAVYGQVDFKWIFYASVGKEGGSSSGGGGKKIHVTTTESTTEPVSDSDTESVTKANPKQPASDDITNSDDTNPSDEDVDDVVINQEEPTTDEDITSDNPDGSPSLADQFKKIIEKLPGGKVLTGAEDGDFAIVVILYISVILLILLAAYVAYRQYKLNKRKNI